MNTVKKLIWFAPAVWWLSVLASFVFSPHRHSAWSGWFLSERSLFALSLLLLVMVLAAFWFSSRSRILYFWLLVFVFFVGLLSVQFFFKPLVFWNDLAWLGLLVLCLSLALLTLSFRGNSGFLISVLLGVGAPVAFAAAAFLLTLINWPVLYLIAACGTASILFFLLKYRRDYFPGLWVIPLIIFLLALIGFSFSGQGWWQEKVFAAQNYLGLNALELRPSLRATFLIGQAVWQERPLVGSGPNTFFYAWSKKRPAPTLSDAEFWDRDFASGFSFLSSWLAETGLIGASGALFFFLTMAGALIVSFWGLKTAVRDWRPLVFVSGLSSALLLLGLSLSDFSWPVLLLTFISLGLFFNVNNFRLPRVSRLGFAVASGFLAAFLLFAGYWLGVRLTAWHYYSKGLTAARSESGFAGSVVYFKKAAQIAATDVFYRTWAEVNLRLIGSSPAGQWQTLAEEAILAAKGAVAVDPAHYRNWLTQGRVYETLFSLGVAGATEAAEAAFGRAQALNPQSPEPLFALGRLKLRLGDKKAAREFLEQTLSKKPDFWPALGLLAQMQIEAGEFPASLTNLRQAVLKNSTNFAPWFQLGYLLFTSRQFAEAKNVLSRAVALRPNHADARYFLALTYERLGQGAASEKERELLQSW